MITKAGATEGDEVEPEADVDLFKENLEGKRKDQDIVKVSGTMDNTVAEKKPEEAFDPNLEVSKQSTGDNMDEKLDDLRLMNP